MNPETGNQDLTVIGEYELKLKLGESNYAAVWRAEHRVSREHVAVKQVELSKLNHHLRDCLDCELRFLSSVNHPNIVRLLDVFQAANRMFLVMEFCDGGDLASYIQLHGTVREHIARSFIQQLAAGLEVLHSHHIIHRDLKPQNILLSGEAEDIVLKIADFGLARNLHPDKFAETVCGSPLYMAPEVLQFQKYDAKLLNGYPPFQGRTNCKLLQNIKSCTCLPFSSVILPDLHPDCIDLCSRLLSANPACRLSFDEFCHHSFLRRKAFTNPSSHW